MRKTISLSEVRKMFKDLENDWFYLEDNKITKPMMGKYMPNMTYQFDNSFVLDADEKPRNPINGIGGELVKDYLAGTGINFNPGSSNALKILTGEISKTKNGGLKFCLQPPTKAKDVLVTVDWTGGYRGPKGCSEEYARQCEPEYFRKASSSGGRIGYDYWVFPVGKVLNAPDRDVSEYMLQIEEAELERELADEEKVNEKYRDLKEVQDYIKGNRAELESLMQRIAELRVEVSAAVEEFRTIIDSKLNQKFEIDEYYQGTHLNNVKIHKWIENKQDIKPMKIVEESKGANTKYYIGLDQEKNEITKDNDMAGRLKECVKAMEEKIRQARKSFPLIETLALKAAENGSRLEVFSKNSYGADISDIYIQLRDKEEPISRCDLKDYIKEEETIYCRPSRRGLDIKPKEIEQEYEYDAISKDNDDKAPVLSGEVDYEDAYLNACEACIMNDMPIPPVPEKENDLDMDFERD